MILLSIGLILYGLYLFAKNEMALALLLILIGVLFYLSQNKKQYKRQYKKQNNLSIKPKMEGFLPTGIYTPTDAGKLDYANRFLRLGDAPDLKNIIKLNPAFLYHYTGLTF